MTREELRALRRGDRVVTTGLGDDAVAAGLLGVVSAGVSDPDDVIVWVDFRASKRAFWCSPVDLERLP